MDNYWQPLIPTFIGALLAFIFSIFLFYLTEKWKSSRANKNLSTNLQREFDYNIQFLESYKSDFEKLVRAVSSNNKFPLIIFRFYKLQRLFILEAFNKGLLYQYLDADDINQLDTMLNYFNNISDTMAWNTLNGYKNNIITQQSALETFEYGKDQIDKYIGIQKKLKNKLKKLK